MTYSVHWARVTLLTEIMLHLSLQTHTVTVLPDLRECARERGKERQGEREREDVCLVTVHLIVSRECEDELL